VTLFIQGGGDDEGVNADFGSSSNRRMCDANGVGLLIVVIPSIEQVISPELFETDFDIRLPQKYLMDFSSRKSIAYLDLWPALTYFYEEAGGKSVSFV